MKVSEDLPPVGDEIVGALTRVNVAVPLEVCTQKECQNGWYSRLVQFPVS